MRLNTGFWPAKSAGLTPYEAMNDAKRGAKAWKDFNLKFQPDALGGSPAQHRAGLHVRGPRLQAVLLARPWGVQEASYQYNEKEWMLPEEYDHLISDPTDYLMRIYLPRTVGAFSGFAACLSLLDFIELPFVFGQVGGWGSAGDGGRPRSG